MNREKEVKEEEIKKISKEKEAKEEEITRLKDKMLNLKQTKDDEILKCKDEVRRLNYEVDKWKDLLNKRRL